MTLDYSAQATLAQRDLKKVYTIQNPPQLLKEGDRVVFQKGLEKVTVEVRDGRFFWEGFGTTAGTPDANYLRAHLNFEGTKSLKELTFLVWDIYRRLLENPDPVQIYTWRNQPELLKEGDLIAFTEVPNFSVVQTSGGFGFRKIHPMPHSDNPRAPNFFESATLEVLTQRIKEEFSFFEKEFKIGDTVELYSGKVGVIIESAFLDVFSIQFVDGSVTKVNKNYLTLTWGPLTIPDSLMRSVKVLRKKVGPHKQEVYAAISELLGYDVRLLFRGLD